MTYREILKFVGYPEQMLVIDFETFYDTDYSLSKMSTIEYIQDPRFDFTGCGLYCSSQLFPEGPLEGICFIPPNEISYYLSSMPWNDITIVAKNCKFDITLLVEKFSINPPYIIDIDDLLRHYDARMSHKMKDVTKMFGLQPKGDTAQFKGLHYEEMDQEMRDSLRDYAINDVEIEASLIKILLPTLTNPTVEIPIARHTLDLYLRPRFVFDFKKAKYLTASMTLAMLETLEKVSWVKSYAAN